MLQSNSAPQPEHPFQSGSSLVPEQQITAEYHLKQGKRLYQNYLTRSSQQDLTAAIQHFQKAVEIEPNLAEAYVQLAGALWDQGTINLELAQFYCQTAMKLDPRQADAHLFLGYFLQRGGFLAEAVEQYRHACRKNIWKSARSNIALGHALLKQALQTEKMGPQLQLASQGIGRFAMGCALLPLDKQTCLLLKEALVSDAQVYGLTVVANGFKKLRLPRLAQHMYHLGTRVVPKEPMFFHLLGDACLYDQNNPNEAIACYRQAQVLDPGNLALLKKMGRAYAMIHNIPKAVETLHSVIEQQADDFESVYQLAQIHMEEKALFKALYYLKEADRLRPNYPYIHSNMGYVLFKMGDVEGAYEEYKLATEFGTDPEWLSTVYQTLATICYQVFGKLPEALEYLEHALHYHPENKDALAMIADLYFESGQMETAISAYKSILQLEPQNSDCYSNIGYILWQMDRNQAAIDAYMAAIYYDRKNHVAHNNLGVIYLDEELNPEKALALFETALSLNPEYTLACFNTARALEALGKTMDAAEKYSEALTLNQAHPELEDHEIQERLEHLFRS